MIIFCQFGPCFNVVVHPTRDFNIFRVTLSDSIFLAVPDLGQNEPAALELDHVFLIVEPGGSTEIAILWDDLFEELQSLSGK